MKPQNEVSMHSNDKSTQPYLDDVREVTFQKTYPEMKDWIQRIRQREKRGTVHRRAGRVGHMFGQGAYKWGIVAIVLIVLAGFVPIRDLDVLGHLIYAEMEGDIIAAKEYLAGLAVPHEQIVYVRPSSQQQTRMVIFLPSVEETEVERMAAVINDDPALVLNETRRIEEEINRSAYDAFFSNVPASLSRFYSKEDMDVLRFQRLSQTVVGEWLNTNEIAYTTGYSIVGDTLRFRIIAGGGTPIPTQREALFEEYDRVDRAIGLLEGETPRIIDAREALVAHRDSLDALISGKR